MAQSYSSLQICDERLYPVMSQNKRLWQAYVKFVYRTEWRDMFDASDNIFSEFIYPLIFNCT